MNILKIWKIIVINLENDSSSILQIGNMISVILYNL